MNLEELAIIGTAVICFYYAAYSLLLILTRQSCEGDLSPFKATMFCSLTTLSGLGLLGILGLMQGSMQGMAAQLQTHGAVFASSAEGATWRGYAYRYLLIVVVFVGLVFFWVRNQLVEPLISCTSLGRQEAPKMTDARDAVAKLELWVWGVLVLLIGGCLFSFVQHAQFSSSVAAAQGNGDGREWQPGLLSNLFGGQQVNVRTELPGARDLVHAVTGQRAATGGHATSEQHTLEQLLQHIKANPEALKAFQGAYASAGHVPATPASAPHVDPFHGSQAGL